MASAKVAQMHDDFIGSIQRQEMASTLDTDHFGSRYKLAVPFFFVGSGPVLVAPEEEDGNPDVWIVLRRRLPAFGVSQQANKGSIVAFSVPDQIHLLQEGSGIKNGYYLTFLSRMAVY